MLNPMVGHDLYEVSQASGNLNEDLPWWAIIALAYTCKSTPGVETA